MNSRKRFEIATGGHPYSVSATSNGIYIDDEKQKLWELWQAWEAKPIHPHLLEEVKGYLQCVINQSISRNNAENLAMKLLEQLNDAKPAQFVVDLPFDPECYTGKDALHPDVSAMWKICKAAIEKAGGKVKC